MLPLSAVAALLLPATAALGVAGLLSPAPAGARAAAAEPPVAIDGNPCRAAGARPAGKQPVATACPRRAPGR
jgi:hypothetical protein